MKFWWGRNSLTATLGEASLAATQPETGGIKEAVRFSTEPAWIESGVVLCGDVFH